MNLKIGDMLRAFDDAGGDPDRATKLFLDRIHHAVFARMKEAVETRARKQEQARLAAERKLQKEALREVYDSRQDELHEKQKARRESIFADFKAGMRQVDIAAKYGIGRWRVGQIIRKEERAERSRQMRAKWGHPEASDDEG
jgi:Mor family transcriptional regulator